MEEQRKEKVLCTNCEAKISAKAVFCPKCGQKKSATKISMQNFLWKLWVTTIHIDNKFFSSLRHIFFPPKLTREYFAGRHRKYLHPLQFFFISMFFLLFLISKTGKGKNNINFFQMFGPEGSTSVRVKLDIKAQLTRDIDSLPVAWRTELTRKSVDSLLSRVTGPHAFLERDSISMLGLFKDDAGKDYSISTWDILKIPADSLLDLYKVNGWFDRLCIGQYSKALTHENELRSYWVGLLSWSLLALVVVMAGWLKLLYLRRDRYFVEHFVLMLHLQIGFFITFIVSLLLRKYLGFGKNIIWFCLGWFLLASLIAFRRYYAQGYVKTFLKWACFHFLYWSSFLAVLIVSVGVAVLLF